MALLLAANLDVFDGCLAAFSPGGVGESTPKRGRQRWQRGETAGGGESFKGSKLACQEWGSAWMGGEKLKFTSHGMGDHDHVTLSR